MNSTKKLSFDDFFNEFFSGIFAYDSRLKRTLRALIFYPGKISKDYIQGKRIRYANPFRFYLSASIVFFIIWSFTNSFQGVLPSNPNQINQLSNAEREELKRNLDSIPAVQRNIANLDPFIPTLDDTSAKSYRDVYISQKELDGLSFSASALKQFDLYNTFHKETAIFGSGQALDSLNHDPSRFNRLFYEKVVDLNLFQQNPEIFLSYFISKLPFIIFFYLPIFAMFIWLLYLRRPFNYMEHLIFVFHIQTTFFVLMAIALIIDAIFTIDTATGIAIMIFLFYLYLAMRRFYRQGRFKTLVKFLLLNGIFLTLAIIAAVISLIASFAIY
ncbi:MAG: DUF3667 domain-containing protein [Bacteroidota bacterium]